MDQLSYHAPKLSSFDHSQDEATSAKKDHTVVLFSCVLYLCCTAACIASPRRYVAYNTEPWLKTKATGSTTRRRWQTKQYVRPSIAGILISVIVHISFGVCAADPDDDSRRVCKPNQARSLAAILAPRQNSAETNTNTDTDTDTTAAFLATGFPANDALCAIGLPSASSPHACCANLLSTHVAHVNTPMLSEWPNKSAGIRILFCADKYLYINVPARHYRDTKSTPQSM